MLTSVIDKDASHYLCCEAVKVRSILPLNFLIDEFQISLIHQSRRLQRVIVGSRLMYRCASSCNSFSTIGTSFSRAELSPSLHAASSWVTSLVCRGDIPEFVSANGKSWERGIEIGMDCNWCDRRNLLRHGVASNEAANCSHEFDRFDWLTNVNIEAGSQCSCLILLVSMCGKGYCDQLLTAFYRKSSDS
jgi:hypothetical protein